MTEPAYDGPDRAARRSTTPRQLFDASLLGRSAAVGLVEQDSRPELDFGPLRVRVPAEARPRIADENDAVFFDFPGGWIRLSVLAAPRGGGLWSERAKEIAASQAGLGAAVSSTLGEWGPELRIVSNGETNLVIGVDGERWMLLARATWTTGEPELIETMREMIRSSAVDRGDEPFPVRAPIRLTMPDTAGRATTGSERDESPYASVITLVASDPPTQPYLSVVDPPPRLVGAADELADRRAPDEPADPESASADEAGRGRRGGMMVAAGVLLLVGIAGVSIGVRERSPASSSPQQTSSAPVAAPALPPPTAPIRPSMPANGPVAPTLALPGPRQPDAVVPSPASVRAVPKATPAPVLTAPGRGTPSSEHARTRSGEAESDHDTRRPRRHDERDGPLDPLGDVVQGVVPSLR